MEERIKEIQAAYPESSKLTVILCMNNDEEALNFVHKVVKNHEEKVLEQSNFILKQHLPKHQDGDWNEVLEYKKTGRLASRELKEKETIDAQSLRNKLLETQLYRQGVEQ